LNLRTTGFKITVASVNLEFSVYGKRIHEAWLLAPGRMQGPDACCESRSEAGSKNPSAVSAFQTLIFESAIISWKQSASLPPLTRQVFIAPDTTVKKLAALLGQKPFKIICDLVQLGTFATVDEVLDFKVVSMVAKMNGFAAIKAG
jgi:hypothetical protein